MAGVVALAVTSRLLVILIQVVVRAVVRHHQLVAYNPLPYSNSAYTPLVGTLLEGQSLWDGKYFLHIAEHGYTDHQSLVYYPLFPALVRIVAHNLVSYMLPFHDAILVSAIVVNIAAFTIAARCLFHIARKLLPDTPQAASLAVFYFCINPASVFFTAAYSESLFSALTFAALLCLEKDWLLTSAMLFRLSVLTRANGAITGAIFLSYAVITRFYALCREKRYVGTLGLAAKSVVMLPASVMPFILLQCRAFLRYCPMPFRHYTLMMYKSNVPLWVIDYGKICLNKSPAKLSPPDYLLPIEYDKTCGHKSAAKLWPADNYPPWCYDNVPMSYGYIQREVWGVGFLQYYKWKNVPHFLLALPIILLSVRSGFTWGSSARFMPYRAHLGFLVAFCMLNIHVQMVTRIVCSSTPLIYLALAARYCAGHRNTATHWYCYTYVLIGTILHCTYYPWT